MFDTLTSAPRLARAAVAATLFAASGAALADVVTFDGRPGGAVMPGPVFVEGAYSWTILTGGGWHGVGAPSPGLEALSSAGGGVASFFRNDVVGGLFSFDASDIARFLGPDPADIVFEGYLGGVMVASDTLTTGTGFAAFITATSVGLASVAIDELRVRLDVGEMVDNLRFTSVAAVPAPGTAALLGLALAGLALTRRTQRH